MSTSSKRTWNPETVISLLSHERMDTYLRASDGNLDEAFALYKRNMHMAGLLQMVTAMVEVVVRNAIDGALVKWSTQINPHADWFDSPLLDSRTKEIIRVARSQVLKNGHKPGHGAVLAEISFGFWRFITSKRHLTSLWIPALQYAFPYGCEDAWTRQKQVSKLLNNMTFIRNRAAHLEPVFQRDLQRDIEEARLLLGWVSPDAVAWFDDTLHT